MIFWIVTTALALAVSGLLALALLRRKTDAEPPAAYDLRVYRDQLKEVDRDLARLDRHLVSAVWPLRRP